MLRPSPLLAILLAAIVLALSASSPAAHADTAATKQWKVWKGDLAHLYEVIEKESSLKLIMKAKGIEWKAVRKTADKRFKDAAAAAKKRKKTDARADEIAFYEVLRYVVGQLRDSHAYVSAGAEIDKAWWDAQPKRFDAGIELQPGPFGTIVVANTFAARDSNSPLYARGIRHDGTLLESVNGTPAAEYFDEFARVRREEDGWQSTHSRALSDAFNGLQMEEKGKLKLVFKVLDASEKALKKYVVLPQKKREAAFAKLKWKTKKVSLNATECAKSSNPRNFRYMGLERPEMTKTSDDSVWYCQLPSGIGYVAYYKVNANSRNGLADACKALADAPGLILDIRWNGGGGDGNVTAFDKREGVWKKPLAVLIGPRSFSAAETEIWQLQQMRGNKRCDARFFGRSTAGASGNKISFELPSGFATGRFVFRHWHGGRSQIEGNGLDPDEVAHQDPVELRLGIDSCVRRAEEWIVTQ